MRTVSAGRAGITAFFLRHLLYPLVLLGLPGVGIVSGCGGDPGPAVQHGRDLQNSIALNASWMLGTHNSYWALRSDGDLQASGVGERLLDQLLANSTRSIELDLHKGETPHTFRVYHTLPGNSLCDSLAECLAILRTFQRTLPDHQPLLVMLEQKSLFDSLFDINHTPEDLDQILRDELGPSLYRPADFMAPCTGADQATLSGCAQAVGWPSLAELRGRVLVTTFGYWHDLGGQDDIDWITYATPTDIRDRSAFPMTMLLHYEKLDEETKDRVTPEQLQQANAQAVFMQGEDFGDPDVVSFAAAANQGMVRMDGTSTFADQEHALAMGLQVLQTDTPWVVLPSVGPLQPLHGLAKNAQDATGREPGRRLRLDAAAAPDSADSRVFAYVKSEPGSHTAWESTLSSGVASDRIGCLRASSALGGGDASSVTICRQVLPNVLGDDAVSMKLQVTTCQGGACATDEYKAQDGQLGGPGDIVALTVDLEADKSCVQAQSARLCDRDRQPLFAPLGGKRCVPGALLYQGLMRQGMGEGRDPVYFFNTRREGVPVAGADLSDVVIEEAPAAPAHSDRSRLQDLSYPAP
jgi:hypothetical protein